MKRIILSLLLLFAIYTLSAQSFADIVQSADSSVVLINVLEKKNTGTGNPTTFANSPGLGSGVLIGENRNYILTAAHVVANSSKIEVVLKDGTKVLAKNRRIDRTSDVALIELSRPVTHLPVAKLGDSDKMRIGDEIFIIGSPLGLAHSVSKGIISGKHTEPNQTIPEPAMEFFQTDAAINKGNSGGPMFNMQGEVIGIVSSILSFSGGFEGLGFAATSNIARNILTQQGRIWFGSEILPLSAEMCQLFNVPQEGALLVQSIVDDSPAYFMGLKGGYIKINIGKTEFLAGGDIILEFDDIPLNSRENMEKFFQYLNGLEKGHQYRVKILRGGVVKNLTWKMGL